MKEFLPVNHSQIKELSHLSSRTLELGRTINYYLICILPLSNGSVDCSFPVPVTPLFKEYANEEQITYLLGSFVAATRLLTSSLGEKTMLCPEK